MSVTRAHRRRLLAGAAVAVVLVVAVVAVVAVTGDEPDAIAQARQSAAHAQAQPSAVGAAEALGEAAQHLTDATVACRGDRPRTARCTGTGAAAGYAQVLAARILACPTPARHQAIGAFLRHLDALNALAADATRPPPLPPLPLCGHGS